MGEDLSEVSKPRWLVFCGDSSRKICQGAEACVWSTTFLGRRSIIKQRFPKKYRHTELDKSLTSQRLKAEVRSMTRARKLGILAPVPFLVEARAASIYMEYIDGKSVKESLREKMLGAAGTLALMEEIGTAIAKLHDGGLVHGDLTTSNMLVRASDRKVVLIDFGLAYNSTNAEDKGVDLYVLERALQAAHSDEPDLFQAVLKAYMSVSAKHSATFNRFAEVRMRGRKRTMVG